MNITMRNYQPAAGASMYQKQGTLSADGNYNKAEDDAQASLIQDLKTQLEEQESSFLKNMAGTREKDSSLSSILEQAKESSDFKVSASTPDVSVGELATMLAQAETKMDVVQVSSKVMRTLANLKMALVLSESEQKQKIQQMVRRMQRLTKKITQKMRNLTQEEQMELQRKRAEKQQALEREREIRTELRRKKNKRHREERNYAAKEVDEDRKQALQDMMSAMPGSTGAASSATAAGLPSPAAAGSGTAAYEAAMSIGAAADAVSVDVPAADVVSVDVAV